jgi:hypothetical protein
MVTSGQKPGHHNDRGNAAHQSYLQHGRGALNPEFNLFPFAVACHHNFR